MGNIPILKPREVVAILERLGFVEIRQRGSHKQFRHPDGRVTTVPCHKGRDISPILLWQIARDIGMTAAPDIAAVKNCRRDRFVPEISPRAEGLLRYVIAS